jgi:hypothetical protein
MVQIRDRVTLRDWQHFLLLMHYRSLALAPLAVNAQAGSRLEQITQMQPQRLDERLRVRRRRRPGQRQTRGCGWMTLMAHIEFGKWERAVLTSQGVNMARFCLHRAASAPESMRLSAYKKMQGVTRIEAICYAT